MAILLRGEAASEKRKGIARIELFEIEHSQERRAGSCRMVQRSTLNASGVSLGE
jgi:hypothetical protein